MTAPKPLRLKDVVNGFEPLTERERGYLAALQDFGIWRDGVQCIGAMNRPIAEEARSFLTRSRKQAAALTQYREGS